jgi:diguanylate cyclase (GGDEF)-like protein
VRWFAVLVALGAVAVVQVALAATPDGLLAVAIGAVGMAGVGIATVVGLRRILGLVDRLDEERHGLREAYDRARLDALRDGLTGLGNHRAFQEELDLQIMTARSEHRTFALVFLDVDDLKTVNDTRGHAAGDDILRAAGRIIGRTLRRQDRGFRIGGDEFAILLQDCTAAEGAIISRRILASVLEGGAATSPGAAFSVTIGVSAFPELATERQQLLHQADAALYWGKRHGRTDVQLFDATRHGMAEDSRALPELAAAVARVAAERLLSPVYQPIHCMITGRVLGYEGLVRPSPAAGFANPGVLFVAAEATGRTIELDRVSLDTVLAGARHLDPSLYLSVNLSPRSLESDAFSPQELLALARRRDIDPTRLVVELTEREAVEDMDRLRTAIAFLRRHGVRIAADDVGAGNAGLRLLSEVQFDIMKVDRSLVRAGARNDPSDAVLRALCELARRRSQTIVAEGVETALQLEVVRSLGFDAAQGYLLGRPAPALDAQTLELEALVDRPEGLAARVLTAAGSAA